LSSTAVLHAVAKTCSTGAASKCGCGRSPSASAGGGSGGGGAEGFKWGGCADNVAFGAEFSRSFCDARWTAAKSRRRNKRSATNLHNYDAGRRVSTAYRCSRLTAEHFSSLDTRQVSHYSLNVSTSESISLSTLCKLNCIMLS